MRMLKHCECFRNSESLANPLGVFHVETVKERAQHAFAVLSLREGSPGSVTQPILAKRLTQRLKRKKPLGASTVGKWLNGTLPSKTSLMVALARELGVDPGWLYFGGASEAPAPAWAASVAGEPPSVPVKLRKEG